jgi:serine phosphatase RsbU (regulator of sigma subunit)
MENSRNTKIVIVEDETVIALHLEETLKDLGYEVLANCLSGEEFLSLIDNKVMPDLVFMDIQLAGNLDGIQTVEELKRKTDIPVIYLTSNSNNTIIERAKLTKPAAFLVKPFDESQVYSAVEISMHSYTKNKELVDEQKKMLELNQLQISELMETQNHLITATWRERELKEELQKTKSIIEAQNKKILDSINYAKRIQKAIIPDDLAMKNALGEYLMVYKPKDVVSGDFPWLYKNGDYTYVAVVDCTGHGVPGAMMSLIGHLLLNDISNDVNPKTPADILNSLHLNLVSTLKQNLPDSNSNDGMDISVCRVNYKTGELLYAGAHRPLFGIINEEFVELKGDKFPIGGIQYEKKRVPFSNHELKINKNDKVFMFSDGLPDQPGGELGKKFSPSRIQELIVSNKSHSLSDMQAIFEGAIDSWMQGHKQIDDILLIGLMF